MNAREKLSQLLYESQFEYAGDVPWYDECAGYLIENGVTVPPCKIGDKLYEICDDIDSEDPTLISELTVTEVGQKNIFFSAYVTPRDDINYSLPMECLGKTVFFTREQAEQAIERRFENAKQG